ncbi:MAG: sugar phosphate isomerase/epimerase [Clostridiaceae bacterium]
MNEITVAAQLYTLRDFLKTPEDIGQTLKRVKAIGYNAVQVSGVGPIHPQVLRQLTDEAGVRICATHISYDRLKNDLDEVIKDHKTWDSRYVGLGSMPQQFRGSKDGYIAFAKEFNEISKRIFDQGLKFIYHDHNFEFEKFDGVTGMDLLLSNTDPETFGFELDTYWIQAGGASPVEWIKKVEGRMEVVHFKDMAIKNGQQQFAEIGEGNLNWRTIIDACRETGVQWYAVEQDVCTHDSFESLQMSLTYLKKFF